MATLYRKYRPQKFADIIGQNHIVNTLKKAIENDQVSHAYLFHGPRGTGKTTTARLLAHRLNCTGAKSAEPCHKCKLCLASINNKNIDLIEIDAASNRGIDDIRALKQGIALSPSMGKYKVYIIDEVHMLTKEAFTALLKTLEEPVAHAIFILATTEFHKVPETIISRCQVYRFRRATDDELTTRLTLILKKEKRTAEADALSFIISRSDGCYRDAESLLGQALTLHRRKIKAAELSDLLGLPPLALIDQFLSALITNNTAAAVATIDDAFAHGYDPEQFLNESVRLLREGALALIKRQESDHKFTSHSGTLAKTPVIMRALIQALQDLGVVPQPLIAVHLAILTICHRPTLVTTTQTAASPSPAIIKTTSAPKSANQPSPLPQARSVAPTASAPITVTKPVVSIDKVKAAWPQVILAIRKNNPVGATFLRAIEPVEVVGDTIRLQTFYSLHQTFFSKPANLNPVQTTLSNLLNNKVKMRFFFAEDRTINLQKKGTDLLTAVRSAFG